MASESASKSDLLPFILYQKEPFDDGTPMPPLLILGLVFGAMFAFFFVVLCMCSFRAAKMRAKESGGNP